MTIFLAVYVFVFVFYGCHVGFSHLCTQTNAQTQQKMAVTQTKWPRNRR